LLVLLLLEVAIASVKTGFEANRCRNLNRVSRSSNSYTVLLLQLYFVLLITYLRFNVMLTYFITTI